MPIFISEAQGIWDENRYIVMQKHFAISFDLKYRTIIKNINELNYLIGTNHSENDYVGTRQKSWQFESIFVPQPIS